MKTIIKIFFLLVLFSCVYYPQTTKVLTLQYKTHKLPFNLFEKVSYDRPTISLALSGGGARGFAQIGVRRAWRLRPPSRSSYFSRSTSLESARRVSQNI